MWYSLSVLCTKNRIYKGGTKHHHPYITSSFPFWLPRPCRTCILSNFLYARHVAVQRQSIIQRAGIWGTRTPLSDPFPFLQSLCFFASSIFCLSLLLHERINTCTAPAALSPQPYNIQIVFCGFENKRYKRNIISIVSKPHKMRRHRCRWGWHSRTNLIYSGQKAFVRNLEDL